jgi:type I restriction enzyme S subunit
MSQTQLLIKDTEVGSIPHDWDVVEINKLGEIITGTTPKTSVPEYYDGAYMFIAPGDINEDKYVKSTQKTLSEEGLNVSRSLPRDTVLVVCIGATIGKVAMTNTEMSATNQQINAIISNKDICADYLYYALKYRSPHLPALAGRAAIPIVNKSSFAKFLIPRPPLAEQRAIAHTLLTIQKAKEARQRELEFERERKAALMQYLFTYGTCNEPSKKTKIGEIPQSWRIVMLGDLCLNGLGIIQTGPFGSQLHASDYKFAGIPVVNPTHLRFNSIVDDAIPRISREKADSLSKHYLIEGDILISRRGDFSRYSYISQQYSGWFCGTGCLLIRLTHPEVDNYFLSILFSTEVIQSYLKLNAVGSIMPNLNTRILQDVPLTLPQIEQQREIAEVLRSCDRKITALEQEAAFLDELFRAMLEELMTGRLSALPLVEEKAIPENCLN